MNYEINVSPGEQKSDCRILSSGEEFNPYTTAYIGSHTYCWNLHLSDGVEFFVNNGGIPHNVQIGRFNSIANNLTIYTGHNHNFKSIETGALSLFLEEVCPEKINREGSTFTQKGFGMLQNDVWIGKDVTIMPNSIIRNGAVIANRSHVVSDIPPYAIAGGNPARVIGYRYPKEIIDKLQKIQWWYWDIERIVENASYFNEDVEGFCEKFYPRAEEEFWLIISLCEMTNRFKAA